MYIVILKHMLHACTVKAVYNYMHIFVSIIMYLFNAYSYLTLQHYKKKRKEKITINSRTLFEEND
jgi:positive regulator of sigma E activity